MWARKRIRSACALATARRQEIGPAVAPHRHPVGAAPNKNPIRQRRIGLSFLSLSRLRGGNESCVHRLGCTGGGSFCTARCRVRSAHSFLQEASAGRNLITLFHSVNNLRKKFSGPTPPRNLATVIAGTIEPDTRSADSGPAASAVFSKALFSRCFLIPREAIASLPALRAASRDRPCRLPSATPRDPKIFFPAPPISRRSTPNCAKLRSHCAAFFGLATRCNRPKRHRPHEAAGGQSMRDRLSGLRLPAARRSRPAQAVR